MIQLSKIEVPSGMSRKEHDMVLSFLASLITKDEDINKYGNLFYHKDILGKMSVSTLSDSIARPRKFKGMKKIDIDMKGLPRFITGTDTMELFLPMGGLSITRQYEYERYEILHTHYLYPFFKDKNTISDHVLYMWYDLFKKLGFYFYKGNLYFYIKKEPSLGFMEREYNIPFSHDYYESYNRDKLLRKEISLGYTNRTIGDASRGYAYTHLIRTENKDTLISQSWYINAIVNIKQLNMIITSRKQGKTSGGGEFIVKELLAEKPGYGRPNRITRLFVDNEKSLGEGFFEKIKAAMGKLVNGVIPAGHMNAGANIFTINESKHQITCNITGNKFYVTSLRNISSDNTSTGEGLDCDVVILDEGFRKAFEEFWPSFTDRMWEETEYVFVLTTVNKESNINSWVYDEMIKGESGGDPRVNTIRSTIYDNSVTQFLNFNKKGLTNEDFKNYIDLRVKDDNDSKIKGFKYVLNRHFCCLFSKEELFNCSSRVRVISGERKDEDFRIIGMDMARSYDHLGVVIFNTQTLQIESGTKYPKMDYPDIIELAGELKAKYNCLIAGDLGGPVGQATQIFDRETKHIDIWIKLTGPQNGDYNQIDDYYTIPKGPFVLAGSNMLKTVITIVDTCFELIEQFGDMDDTVFKARGKKKDDIVFGFLNIFGFLSIIYGYKDGESIKALGKSLLKNLILEKKQVQQYDESNDYNHSDDEGSYYSNGVNY